MSPFDILIFLLVLGLLIFVHEMGHFLAAKACGIYVDRFSLGMPPRLFGFKWGETDYCIGALPIGGYVKMAGQEDAPLSEEEREATYGQVPPERWFNNKPRYQRAFVLIAGPAMNLVLGFVIYAIMAGVGGQVPLSQYDNRVGMIEEESPAMSAPMYEWPEGQPLAEAMSEDPDTIGWQTGDRLVEINGKTVKNVLQDVATEAILSPDKAARFKVVRATAEGDSTRYLAVVQPAVMDDPDMPRFGVMPYETAYVGYVRPGSPAADAGLQKGDEILRANGKPVDRNTLTTLVRELPAGADLALLVLRDGELLPMTVASRSRGNIDGISFVPPILPVLGVDTNEPPAVVEDDAAFREATGLREGDVIVAISAGDEAVDPENLGLLDPEKTLTATVRRGGWFGGGDETESVELSAALLLQGLTGFAGDERPVVEMITDEAKEATGLQRRDIITTIDGAPATIAKLRDVVNNQRAESVAVEVLRPSLFLGLGQKESTFEAVIPVTSVQEIGVVWDTKTVYHRAAPANILPEAWDSSVRVVSQVMLILGQLVTGELSAKMLGGPVMIYEVTTGAARTNFLMFLDIIAMISINLAIFNLLPLPVLDGGQLVMIGIEAIRRKPVSMRVQEAVLQVGLLLIIGLLVYVTFNDVSRIFTRMLP